MFEARAGTQRRRELREEPAGSRGSVLALDLGGTQIRAAAVRQDGSGAARRARPTPVDEGPAALVRACRARPRGGDGPDARHVAEAEDVGIAAAHKIMEEARRAFAAACVGWVDVFDPDLIVVGGGVALGQGERLLRPARGTAAREACRTPPR